MIPQNNDLCFSTLLDTSYCPRMLSTIDWIPKVKKHFEKIRKFVSSSTIGSLSIPTTIRGDNCVLYLGWWTLSKGQTNVSKSAVGVEKIRSSNEYLSNFPRFSDFLNMGQTNEQHVLRSQFVSQSIKNMFGLKYSPGYVLEVFHFGEKFICFNEEIEGRITLDSGSKIGISSWKIGTPIGPLTLEDSETNIRLASLDRNYANIILMLGIDCEKEFFSDSGEINWDNPKLLSKLVTKTFRKGVSLG